MPVHGQGRSCGEETPSGMTRSHRRQLLLVMCVGYFLVLLDVTVVNVALPSIGLDVGTGVSGLQWVVDGYAVALASLLLVGGAVGDVHGHRRVVLVGLVVFAVASLACGLAPSVGLLVGGRVLQGVGAALLLPGTLAIIGDAFPGRAEQARAIGVWAAVGSAALPAGPLLGGALVEGLSWRAVFLINVPIALAAALRVGRLVPGGGGGDARRRVDWPGAALAGSALAVTVFVVIDVGHQGPSPWTVVGGVGAVLLALAFVLVETRSPDPMLPLPLLRRPSFTIANAVAGAMNLGTLGLLFLLTLFLQRVQGYSPLGAGLALLPLFLPLSLLAPLAGRLTARLGARLPMVAGLLVAAGGVVLFARLDAHSGYAGVLPLMLAWGIGLGLLTPAVVAAALASVDPGYSGLASGVNNTARQAAGAVGIAAYGAVAGSPAATPRFLLGLHHAGLATAALFLVAAAASAALLPGHAGRRRRARRAGGPAAD